MLPEKRDASLVHEFRIGAGPDEMAGRVDGNSLTMGDLGREPIDVTDRSHRFGPARD